MSELPSSVTSSFPIFPSLSNLHLHAHGLHFVYLLCQVLSWPIAFVFAIPHTQYFVPRSLLDWELVIYSQQLCFLLREFFSAIQIHQTCHVHFPKQIYVKWPSFDFLRIYPHLKEYRLVICLPVFNLAQLYFIAVWRMPSPSYIADMKWPKKAHRKNYFLQKLQWIYNKTLSYLSR